MNNFLIFDRARLKIFIIFLATFIYHTQGFHTLSQLVTDIIVIIAFFVIFFYEDLKLSINQKILNIFLAGFSLGFLILLFGLFSTNLYDLKVAYRLVLPAILIWLGYSFLSEQENPKTLALFGLNIYYKFIFVLIAFNAITFIAVTFFGLEPFFSRSYGTQQTTTYFNFILASPSEPDRFISHFGEPSDFALVACSGIMISLHFGLRKLSFLALLLLTVSFSGSLIIVWIIYLFSLGIFLLPVLLSLFSLFLFIQIDIQSLVSWVYQQDSFGVKKFFQRFINLQSNEIQIGRIELMRIYLQNISFLPRITTNNEVFSFLINYSFYAFLRLGYFLSFIFFIWYLKIIYDFIKNINRYFKLALLSLIILSLVRESFLTSLFFSYLIIMIYFVECEDNNK